MPFLSPPHRWRSVLLIALAAAGGGGWVVQGLSPGVAAAQQATAPAPAPGSPSGPGLGGASNPPAASQVPLTTKVGILRAHQRLGREVPLGTGIVIGHVEGNAGEYLPNWEDLRYRAVEFVRRSGEGKVFGHADAVGRMIYGREGLAPGVREVHCFASGDWLTEGYLHAGLPEPPADDDGPRVFNHSWISNGFPGAEHVLHRIDYQIDARGVIMCVGVNNGAHSDVPALLASAYNVIAVGVSSGNSSGGFTKIDTPGRCKPDLVVPTELTSWATAVTTAITARLLEAADALGSDRDRAARPETIKAVLLAGATKPEGWDPEPGRPLDEHLGAGEIHFDRSLEILQSGPADPGPLRRRYGWDFRALAPGSGPGDHAHYRFSITQPLGAGSIALTWHRRVQGRVMEDTVNDQRGWGTRASLADLDLRLVRLEEGGTRLEAVAASTSLIDNVEHIFVPGLEPGDYVIEVRRRPDGQEAPWDYALAWRFDEANGD